MREDMSDRNLSVSVDGFSENNYLCCFGHAHCKTGAQTIAYFELVALTSLLSYLLASFMVYGYSSTLTYGIIISLVQAFFVFSLIIGINSENGKLLIANLVALCFLIICLFLHIIVVLYACLDKYPNLSNLRKTALPRIILSIISALLIGASVRMLYRCYRYFMDLESIRSHSSAGLIPICSDRFIQPPLSLSVEDLNRAASEEEKKIDFRHRQSVYYEATEDFDDLSDTDTSNYNNNSYMANSNYSNIVPIIVVNGIGLDRLMS
uniref:Uncharacterized protein n=1 Tax=Plectus sambesii TaxID=2011161 RepID=A0A914VNK3_9BILA